MTLILNCLTPNYVIQISDRRLMLSSGLVYDDNSNKAIFVNGNIIFSYTGLASLDNCKTMNDDWFLDTLGEVYNRYPNVSLTTTAEHIAEHATEAMSKINADNTLKRLAFVGVGWAKLPDHDHLSPLYIVISNTHDQDGMWLNEAKSRFSVLPFSPPPDMPVTLVVDGQPLGRELKTGLLHQLKSCVKKDVSPTTTARLLLSAARSVASCNSYVGKDFLVNCIPKETVRVGKLKLIGAYPTRNIATFMYVPENTTNPIQYSPHIFAHGVSCKGMVVYQGAS